jgi:uncharacterized protein
VTLAQRLQSDLTRAIRESDELRRDALRMAIAAAYNAEKQARRPLTDDEVIAVLGREVKTRRESIEARVAAGQAETAAQEQAGLEIIEGYLPEQLSDADLEQMVRETIGEVGATSPREMGRVMAGLMPKVRGRAEGKRVSAAVARQLAQRDLAEHTHAEHEHSDHEHAEHKH